MKKRFYLHLLFFLLAFPPFVSAGRSGPWKLTAFDLYYSGHVKSASGFNTYIYRDMYKYAAAADPEKTGSGSHLSIYNRTPVYYRNSFSADLVLTRYVSHPLLRSKELRAGLSWSYVFNNVNQGAMKYDHAGVVTYARADTTFYYSTWYMYAERALSLNLSYLMNFKLSDAVAFYCGGHVMLSPLQSVKVNYQYENVVFNSIDPDSSVKLSHEFGYASNIVRAGGSFNAGCITGLKFNLDCHWNVFLEYQWLYGLMAFKDHFDISGKGSGFQAGFRYKIGRLADDDKPAGEPEKKIFW